VSCHVNIETLLYQKAVQLLCGSTGVVNLFTIAGRINCRLSLAGRK